MRISCGCRGPRGKTTTDLVLFRSFFGIGSTFERGQGSSGGYLVGPWETLDVPGGSWGVIGSPWELLGSVLGVFWAPRDDQPNTGAHFEGSRDSFRGVKKWPGIAFLRSWEPNSDISRVSSMSTLQV